MTIEEKLKDLILSRYGSMVEFAKAIDMANSTLATIMNRGIHKASISNVIKICKALDISTDELVHDRIVPRGKNIQHRSHMTEINDIISFTKRNIQEYGDLTIDGVPMTQNEIEMLLDALDIGIGIIKRNRKRNEK